MWGKKGEGGGLGPRRAQQDAPGSLPCGVPRWQGSRPERHHTSQRTAVLPSCRPLEPALPCLPPLTLALLSLSRFPEIPHWRWPPTLLLLALRNPPGASLPSASAVPPECEVPEDSHWASQGNLQARHLGQPGAGTQTMVVGGEEWQIWPRQTAAPGTPQSSEVMLRALLCRCHEIHSLENGITSRAPLSAADTSCDVGQQGFMLHSRGLGTHWCTCGIIFMLLQIFPNKSIA